jgi:predicted DNA-binding transcriptional regulator AlpA
MRPTNTFEDNFLDEREAAAFLSLSPRTLQARRAAGTGPTHTRISHRCIRYRVADLIEWMQSLQRVAEKYAPVNPQRKEKDIETNP